MAYRTSAKWTESPLTALQLRRREAALQQLADAQAALVGAARESQERFTTLMKAIEARMKAAERDYNKAVTTINALGNDIHAHLEKTFDEIQAREGDNTKAEDHYLELIEAWASVDELDEISIDDVSVDELRDHEIVDTVKAALADNDDTMKHFVKAPF